MRRIASLLVALGASTGPLLRGRAELVPVPVVTNSPVRIVAANLTGNSQRYEAFATRIFRGLKPDIVAV